MSQVHNQFITLEPVKQENMDQFKEELKAAFIKGIEDSFPDSTDLTEMGPIPTDEDINESLKDKGSDIHHFIFNGEKVGGVVLRINMDSQHNEVIFFYIKANSHSNGIGTRAWQAIEKLYPDTKVWELYTPYFEKRNIHFYVNKCGFKIIEFHHRGNPVPNLEWEEPQTNKEFEFFRFQKDMTVTHPIV